MGDRSLYPAHADGGPRLRILIIEDNLDAAETLRDLLALFGHDAEIAHSGRAGVDLARRRPPDVVLCDIGLPEMDGYAVARELRADPSTAPIHLVALTGYGRDTDRDRAAEAGFDLHLVKPVGPELLQSLLAGIAEGGSRLAGPGDL
jgi:CheY-like chemotaxis protein